MSVPVPFFIREYSHGDWTSGVTYNPKTMRWPRSGLPRIRDLKNDYVRKDMVSKATCITDLIDWDFVDAIPTEDAWRPENMDMGNFMPWMGEEDICCCRPYVVTGSQCVENILFDGGSGRFK